MGKEWEATMTDWWFGTFFIFSIIIGNVIIPIDFHIFQRGSNHQPDEYRREWIINLVQWKMMEHVCIVDNQQFIKWIMDTGDGYPCGFS